MPIKFCVINSVTTYDLIIGRPWFDAMKAVSSTRHQCLKYQYEDKIIKVFGDIPLKECELDTINLPVLENSTGKSDPSSPSSTLTLTDVDPTWSFSRRNLAKAPKSVDEVQMFILTNELLYSKISRTLMLNIGYTPGTGLVMQKQGMLESISRVSLEEKRNRFSWDNFQY